MCYNKTNIYRMIYMQRIMQALYGAVNETCKMIRYIQTGI